MKRKIKTKKITVSITLNVDILDIINEKFDNRSRFLENIIIEELCKDDNIKIELKNKKIIL